MNSKKNNGTQRVSAKAIKGSSQVFQSGIFRLLILLTAIIFSLYLGNANADPYPPHWDNGGINDPVSAAAVAVGIHHTVRPWPADGAWIGLLAEGYDLADPRTSDPSHGGARPQNYVNVSSGCPDKSLPSIYYYYDNHGDADKYTGTVFFRWRVEQIANTYAKGPSPGSYSSGDPWNSALWTVFFDLDGDGYREFAVHLNGSVGSPGSEIAD